MGKYKKQKRKLKPKTSQPKIHAKYLQQVEEKALELLLNNRISVPKAIGCAEVILSSRRPAGMPKLGQAFSRRVQRARAATKLRRKQDAQQRVAAAAADTVNMAPVEELAERHPKEREKRHGAGKLWCLRAVAQAKADAAAAAAGNGAAGPIGEFAITAPGIREHIVAHGLKMAEKEAEKKKDDAAAAIAVQEKADGLAAFLNVVAQVVRRARGAGVRRGR